MGTGKPGLIILLRDGHDYGGASPFYEVPVCFKWAVFMKWSESNDRDLEDFPVSDILDFLQQLLDGGKMPSTLKVYVAAISVFRATIW